VASRFNRISGAVIHIVNKYCCC